MILLIFLPALPHLTIGALAIYYIYPILYEHRIQNCLEPSVQGDQQKWKWKPQKQQKIIHLASLYVTMFSVFLTFLAFYILSIVAHFQYASELLSDESLPSVLYDIDALVLSIFHLLATLVVFFIIAVIFVFSQKKKIDILGILIVSNFSFIGYFIPYILLGIINSPVQAILVYIGEVIMLISMYLTVVATVHIFSPFCFSGLPKNHGCISLVPSLFLCAIGLSILFTFILLIFTIMGSFGDLKDFQDLILLLLVALFGSHVFKVTFLNAYEYLKQWINEDGDRST